MPQSRPMHVKGAAIDRAYSFKNNSCKQIKLSFECNPKADAPLSELLFGADAKLEASVYNSEKRLSGQFDQRNHLNSELACADGECLDQSTGPERGGTPEKSN